MSMWMKELMSQWGGAVHILDRKTANINVKKTYQFKNQYKEDDVIISDN